KKLAVEWRPVFCTWDEVLRGCGLMGKGSGCLGWIRAAKGRRRSCGGRGGEVGAGLCVRSISDTIHPLKLTPVPLDFLSGAWGDFRYVSSASRPNWFLTPHIVHLI